MWQELTKPIGILDAVMSLCEHVFCMFHCGLAKSNAFEILFWRTSSKPKECYVQIVFPYPSYHCIGYQNIFFNPSPPLQPSAHPIPQSTQIFSLYTHPHLPSSPTQSTPVPSSVRTDCTWNQLVQLMIIWIYNVR